MTVTINVPPEKESAWQVHARARGLTVEEWLRQLADEASDEPLPTKKSLAEVIANARGLGEDLDLRRNPSYGRAVDL